MSEYIFAICDANEKYALKLSNIFMERINEPYKIMTFTGAKRLIEFSKANKIEVILITESSFAEEINDIDKSKLIILTENSAFTNPGSVLIDRFQPKEEILKAVIEELSEYGDSFSPINASIKHWKIIGVYSPIKRCLQTSFAITLGQMLGRKNKVLYMNFENYSGLSGLLKQEFDENVVDLLYFFDCAKERLSRRLPAIVKHIGDMDILPPAQSYLDTYDRNGMKWVELLEAVEEVSDYDYLILDLTDSMPGLIEVMSICERIYTMTRNDVISRAKLEQYEKWMTDHAQAGIISKTLKLNIPQIIDLPQDPLLLTHSELAGYVKAIVKEDLRES